MSNHIHLLINPAAKLSRITRAVKNYSARKANEILGRSGSFWQDESFDRWVSTESERERIVSYIEMNPVVAGLVNSPEEWKWSSAFPDAPGKRSTR